MVEESFSEYFSVSSLTTKIGNVVNIATTELVRTVITLYVIMEQPTVPVLVKATIVGALGYFIYPFDIIDDFLPGGLVDDFAILSATLTQVYVYSNQDVRDRVEELLPEWSKEP